MAIIAIHNFSVPIIKQHLVILILLPCMYKISCLLYAKPHFCSLFEPFSKISGSNKHIIIRVQYIKLKFYSLCTGCSEKNGNL